MLVFLGFETSLAHRRLLQKVQSIPTTGQPCACAASPSVAPHRPDTPAHLFEEPLAALMSSSARHSAMVLMLRKAASRAPVVSSQIACDSAQQTGRGQPSPQTTSQTC